MNDCHFDISPVNNFDSDSDRVSNNLFERKDVYLDSISFLTKILRLALSFLTAALSPSPPQ